jgi:hypothetical protein
MNNDGVSPLGNGSSQNAVQRALLKGEPCRFNPEDPEEKRIIQADWLLAGNNVDVENAIVVGVLNFKYATVTQELKLAQCEFRARPNFSYSLFKRNVIFTNTSFLQGLDFDSAILEYDLFASGIKTSGEFETVNLRDARIGGSLFCDDSKFDGAIDCQNLQVGNDVFFRGATFNGAASFSDSRLDGALYFGSNPTEAKSAAKFNNEADFDRISVGGNADFEEVTFSDLSTTVRFRNVSITGDAMFSGSFFTGPVSFANAFSGGQVQFQGAVFKGNAIFAGLKVSRSALFRAAPGRNLPAPVFEREAKFHDLEIGSNADFEGAGFLLGRQWC